MSITSAIVLYAVTWFMVMFLTLPVRLRTQGDVGEKVPGTHDAAPVNFRLKRTMLIVTGIATVIWAGLTWVILSGLITAESLDWRGMMDR